MRKVMSFPTAYRSRVTRARRTSNFQSGSGSHGHVVSIPFSIRNELFPVFSIFVLEMR